MTTRNRSGSIQIDEMKDLLQQMEGNLSKQINDVLKKVESLETSLESVKANQMRLDKEIDSMKLVIVDQQKYIERIEAEKRERNVIFQGIPESTVEVEDGNELEEDEDKIEYPSNLKVENFDRDDIESVRRLGRKMPGRNRHLLVKYEEKGTRDSVLFGQKKLRTSKVCTSQKLLGLFMLIATQLFLLEKKKNACAMS